MTLDISPDSSASSESDFSDEQPTSPKTNSRGNVFARLQALFPSSPSTNAHGSNFSEHTRRDSIPPKFLKIRVMSWNHHESLPKGDLVELLGEVTPIGNDTQEHPPLTSIPQFAPDGAHPYHLVVVAGQECPSLSGIPLGLGAGFKLKDKEKEGLPEVEPAAPSNSYGWTAILEDWYSHAGSAHVVDRRRGFRNVPGIPNSPVTASTSMPDLKRRKSMKPPPERKGPYEMLIKERMMGLYLAIYIHRDIKHLVRGTSKSAVTAGLIGGRVGNKGGVGISVNLDGSTLLFINAHLAAHEGKVMHRLNNMQKIKANLAVDDFLDQDDPRVMAEDLTDRFDYSFVFGDLNFRLDISRLHADWLIARKEYAQALAFDQLRNLMQSEQAFVGFDEAPIDFPPTFKYDVLRTIKRSKSKRHRYSGDNTLTVVEVEEPDHELDDEDGEGDEGEGEGEGEAASMASSTFTSTHSKGTFEQGDTEDDYFSRSKASRASTGNLVNKVWAATAAHKAKAKWMGLLSPGTPGRNSPSMSSPKRWSNKIRRSSLDDAADDAGTVPSTPAVQTDNLSTKSTLPGNGRADTNSNPIITLTEEEIEDDDRGVYDTSSKKRVPSWCDRILFKSTVEPDPEDEDEMMETSSTRPRTRVGQFFASAFRMRPRKASHSSYASASTESAHPPPTPSKEDPPSEKGPFSRFVQPPSPESKRSASIDGPPRPDPQSNLTRSVTVGADLAKQRRRVSAGIPLPRSKTTPAALDMSRTPGPPTLPPHIPLDLTLAVDTPPPVPPKDIRHMPSRWRFLPFFRNASQSTLAHDLPATPDEDPVTPVAVPRPRKGDVVCLSYGSLDDRGMRRLEGRSDHRPIIGSYAVYI